MITKTAVFLLDNNELTKIAALNPEGVARVKDALTNIGSDFREYFLNPELNRVELCDIPYHSYQYISKLLGRPTLPEGTSGHLVMYPRSFLHEAAHHTYRIPRYSENDEVTIDGVLNNIKLFDNSFDNPYGAYQLIPEGFSTSMNDRPYVERLVAAMAGRTPYKDTVSMPYYVLRQGKNPFDIELYTTYNPTYKYIQNRPWYSNVIRPPKKGKQVVIKLPKYEDATFFNINSPNYTALHDVNPNTLVTRLDHELTGLGDIKMTQCPQSLV